MKDYIAIIADIKQSREVKDRLALQEELKAFLNKINTKYAEDIAADFVMSQGDSFQGLVNSDANFGEIIVSIELGLPSVEMRFGIGIGSITTEIVHSNSNEVDGPAYHLAREMLEEIKRGEESRQQYQTNYKIADEKKRSLDLENACFSLISVIQSLWTVKQMEVIKTFHDNDYVQTKTAEALGREVSTISRSLQSSSYYNLAYAWEQLNTSIYKKMQGEQE